MMRLAIILIFGCMPILINAQKLTFGLSVLSPTGLDNIMTQDELVYYLSDDVNSIYSLKSNETLSRSGIYPKAFVQYMLDDNWFLNYEFGFLSYYKVFNIGIKNDFIETDKFARYNYSFITNSALFGHKFLRKREVRPKLFFGLSLFSLVGFKESTNTSDDHLLAKDGIQGGILHQQISSIKSNFLNAFLGFGIEYYFLNIDLIYDRSLGKIDNGDYRSFYNKYHGFYILIGVDILNIIPNSSKKVTGYSTFPK